MCLCVKLKRLEVSSLSTGRAIHKQSKVVSLPFVGCNSLLFFSLAWMLIKYWRGNKERMLGAVCECVWVCLWAYGWLSQGVNQNKHEYQVTCKLLENNNTHAIIACNGRWLQSWFGKMGRANFQEKINYWWLDVGISWVLPKLSEISELGVFICPALSVFIGLRIHFEFTSLIYHHVLLEFRHNTPLYLVSSDPFWISSA